MYIFKKFSHFQGKEIYFILVPAKNAWYFSIHFSINLKIFKLYFACNNNKWCICVYIYIYISAIHYNYVALSITSCHLGGLHFFPWKHWIRKGLKAMLLYLNAYSMLTFFVLNCLINQYQQLERSRCENHAVNYFSVISKITFSNHSDNIPMITDFFMTVPLCSSFMLLN